MEAIISLCFDTPYDNAAIIIQVKITDMQIQGVQKDLLPGDPVCAPAMVVMAEAFTSMLKNLHKNRAWTDIINNKITAQLDKVNEMKTLKTEDLTADDREKGKAQQKDEFGM